MLDSSQQSIVQFFATGLLRTTYSYIFVICMEDVETFWKSNFWRCVIKER